MTMPPSTGSEPPDRLVPLPRATNGTRSRWHSRTVSTTSPRVSGSTTAEIVAGAPGVSSAVGRVYVYNLAGKALPDPSATYRIEITLPNGQVVTASFGLKP